VTVGSGDGEVDELSIRVKPWTIGLRVSDLVTDLDVFDRPGGHVSHQHACVSGKAVREKACRRIVRKFVREVSHPAALCAGFSRQPFHLTEFGADVAGRAYRPEQGNP